MPSDTSAPLLFLVTRAAPHGLDLTQHELEFFNEASHANTQ